MGTGEFSVIAVQNCGNSFKIEYNTYKLPVFASSAPVSASFGEDPAVLYVLQGNYLYKY